MPVARPRFAISTSSTAGFVFPMNGISNLRMGPTQERRGRVSPTPRPLLHQRRSFLNDATGAESSRVTIPLSYATTYAGGVLQLVDYLWDLIGSSKRHLWIIDDDQNDTLTTSNNEVAGAAVNVEYNGSTKKTWFNVGNYLFLGDNGIGSGDEVVVCDAHVTGPPHYFTADLAYLHNSGTASYRISVVYPNAILIDIRHTPPLLGKSVLNLDFISGELPLFGSSLPT